MENSQNPQPTPESQTPSPAPQAPAPQTPVDNAKTVRTGWIIFGIGVIVTIVGLLMGFALAVSAILFAFAGRLGLQAKNKPLAITALVLCGITLLLFILALATN